VWYTLLVILIWESIAQVSVWPTQAQNTRRTSWCSAGRGPIDQGTLQTRKRWLFNDFKLAPIFIVGNSFTFRMIDTSATNTPEGQKLQLFDVTDNGVTLWEYPEVNQENLLDRFYMAFPGNEGSSAYACALNYRLNDITYTPKLYCFTVDGHIIFTYELPQLANISPTSSFYIGMEFMSLNELLITNRGSDLNGISTYVLFNVTSQMPIWNATNIFDIDLPRLKYTVNSHFTPTIYRNYLTVRNYLFVTDTLADNLTLSAFAYDFTRLQTALLWSHNLWPDFDNTHKFGIPMFVELSSEGVSMVLVSLNYPNNTKPSTIIAFEYDTGMVKWKAPFPEPIIGYAYVTFPDILYVSSTHNLLAFNVSSTGIISRFRIYSDTNFFPISAPTVDVNRNIFICDNGKIIGFDEMGTEISSVVDETSVGQQCDQPILMSRSVLVRTGLTSANPGLFYAESQVEVPAPPGGPEGITPGGIVGIIIGLIFLALLVFVIVRRRRQSRSYLPLRT